MPLFARNSRLPWNTQSIADVHTPTVPGLLLLLLLGPHQLPQIHNPSQQIEDRRSLTKRRQSNRSALLRHLHTYRRRQFPLLLPLLPTLPLQFSLMPVSRRRIPKPASPGAAVSGPSPSASTLSASRRVRRCLEVRSLCTARSSRGYSRRLLGCLLGWGRGSGGRLRLSMGRSG
jgi:hypothetical protein